MVKYIPSCEGGYLSRIKVETDSMLLIIDIESWFPNTKGNVTKLLKIMYKYDYSYEMGKVLDNLILRCEDILCALNSYGSDKDKKRMKANIEQMKLFNGLHCNGEIYN